MNFYDEGCCCCLPAFSSLDCKQARMYACDLLAVRTVAVDDRTNVHTLVEQNLRGGAVLMLMLMLR